jgi:hypothetical protein
MVDAAVLETVAEWRVGSTPTRGTLGWSNGRTNFAAANEPFSGGSIPSPKTKISISRCRGVRFFSPTLEVGARWFESSHLDCDCSITVNALGCDLGYRSSILLSHQNAPIA